MATMPIIMTMTHRLKTGLLGLANTSGKIVVGRNRGHHQPNLFVLVKLEPTRDPDLYQLGRQSESEVFEGLLLGFGPHLNNSKFDYVQPMVTMVPNCTATEFKDQLPQLDLWQPKLVDMQVALTYLQNATTYHSQQYRPDLEQVAQDLAQRMQQA